MSATGAAAAVGTALGISATAAAIGTSLVLGATGVNAKIDKAASKVFGKDLVTVANIAGAFYMATDGFSGWGGEGAATDYGLASASEAAGGLVPQAAPAVGGAVDYGLSSGSLGAGAGAGLAAPQAALPAAASSLPADMALNPSAVRLGAMSPGGVAGNVTNRPAILNKALDAWNGADPRTKSALIQAGGQVLSGYSQGKMAEEQARMQEERDRRYRSGSGLKRW